MGAEKHVDQLVRGQGPRPRGGQTTPNATILVAIRLAHRHVTQEIRPTYRLFRRRWRCQKPKKAPNPGGNPGNPRKWAKTEDTEQPKGRGRGKGKGKGKTGKPKKGGRNEGDKIPRKTGAIGLGTSPAGARTRRRARSASAGPWQRQSSERGTRPPAQKGERLAGQ